ncbi:hypothetical protein MTO96_049568 [Rhipicephalus appendiculatus]
MRWRIAYGPCGSEEDGDFVRGVAEDSVASDVGRVRESAFQGGTLLHWVSGSREKSQPYVLSPRPDTAHSHVPLREDRARDRARGCRVSPLRTDGHTLGSADEHADVGCVNHRAVIDLKDFVTKTNVPMGITLFALAGSASKLCSFARDAFSTVFTPDVMAAYAYIRQLDGKLPNCRAQVPMPLIDPFSVFPDLPFGNAMSEAAKILKCASDGISSVSKTVLISFAGRFYVLVGEPNYEPGDKCDDVLEFNEFISFDLGTGNGEGAKGLSLPGAVFAQKEL